MVVVMQEKELQELNEQLEAAGLQPLDQNATPERKAFRTHLQEAKWGEEAWLKKLKKLKENYLLVFHNHLAGVHENLLYEKGEDRVYWLYDEKQGVYDEIAASSARDVVINLLIREGLGDRANESVAKTVLARYRAMYPERGHAYDEFDADDGWFHARNGWLNLETLKFEDHTPTRLSRRVSAVDYDPQAECPTYDKFLDEDVEVAQDAVRVIDQFSGLLLTGDIKYQKMLTIIGRPGSGKSTLLEAWMHILGDLAVGKRLTDLQGDGFRFAGGDLVGRHLCWFDEVDVKRAEMGNTLGNLITGSYINIERKGINGIVRANNTLKCVLTANSMPMSAEQGAYRRLIFIRFDRSFHDEGSVNQHIPEELRKEASGILNRMVRGLQDLRKMRGFTVIAGHDEMIEEYKAESDVAAEFLDTYFEPGTDEDVIYAKDMFDAFKAFNSQGGRLMLTPQRFGQMLKSQPLVRFAHIRSERNFYGRYWQGLKLRPEYEFDHEYGCVRDKHDQGGFGVIRDKSDDRF